MAEKQSATTPARRETRPSSQSLSTRMADPIGMMRRVKEDMDRAFADMGFGGRWLSSPLSRGEGGLDLWSPQVDMFQRGNELVIKADLPGLRKDEVTVDVTEDAVTIQGERRRDHEEEREGVYRSERSYGSFCRVIPLPQGAITDQAKATFRDGVLEVILPAPPEQVRQGRRIEIEEGSTGKK